MLLNLRRDDFLLQALQNSFAFRDRQADGSGRNPVRALNRGNLVFNLFTVNHFSDQLHCPFHPPSLPHPATLHALVGCSSIARDRNSCRRRKRRHSHDSYGFGAQLRT